VVLLCDGRGCGAFAFREPLGNRSVDAIELVDAFDEYVLELVIAVAGLPAALINMLPQ
jgi:hypothetical protein